MALTVDFDGSGSSGGDTEAIVDYAWDFGDGSPAGSGVTTSHTYAAPGDYNVSLTVTNSCGGIHSSTQCVRVTIEKKIVTFNSVPTDANVQILT